MLSGRGLVVTRGRAGFNPSQCDPKRIFIALVLWKDFQALLEFR